MSPRGQMGEAEPDDDATHGPSQRPGANDTRPRPDERCLRSHEARPGRLERGGGLRGGAYLAGGRIPGGNLRDSAGSGAGGSDGETGSWNQGVMMRFVVGIAARLESRRLISPRG